jgi:UDP-N-acetylglucosamine acyltransferase
MIHTTAIIGKNTKIHDSVEIGPYAIIEDDVTIGEGTLIGAHAFIGQYANLGKENHIHAFASVGSLPQDKKFKNEKSELLIGDNNTIREFVTINRGTADGGGITKIGNFNWIMAYVHIAHDCLIGNENIFANKATLAGHVEVNSKVILGGSVNIHQFVKVGSHAFLAANSYINMDILPFTMAQGIPASVKGINTEGLKRLNFDQDEIRLIKNAFKIIFRQKNTLEEALIKLNALNPESESIQLLISAINASTRGITR